MLQWIDRQRWDTLCHRSVGSAKLGDLDYAHGLVHYAVCRTQIRVANHKQRMLMIPDETNIML